MEPRLCPCGIRFQPVSAEHVVHSLSCRRLLRKPEPAGKPLRTRVPLAEIRRWLELRRRTHADPAPHLAERSRPHDLRMLAVPPEHGRRLGLAARLRRSA